MNEKNETCINKTFTNYEIEFKLKQDEAVYSEFMLDGRIKMLDMAYIVLGSMHIFDVFDISLICADGNDKHTDLNKNETVSNTGLKVGDSFTIILKDKETLKYEIDAIVECVYEGIQEAHTADYPLMLFDHGLGGPNYPGDRKDFAEYKHTSDESIANFLYVKLRYEYPTLFSKMKEHIMLFNEAAEVVLFNEILKLNMKKASE